MKKIFVPMFIFLFALILLLFLSHSVSAATKQKTVTFDVASDGRTFKLNQVDSKLTTISRGDTYIIEGKIFAGDTIPDAGTPDGLSTFGPDHAGSIGTWFSYGTYLVDSSGFKTSKVHRIATHFFNLTDKSRLITEGFEGPVDLLRAVTGGLNGFNAAKGSVTMKWIGMNKTKSRNIRFVFTLD